jgi:hypothetical protein
MKEYFLVGISVLFVAIIFNILLTNLGLATWYDLLTVKNLTKKYISFVVLIVIYPLILGYVAIKIMSYLR